MARPAKLVSVSHSYAVTLNRRLAHEMARVSRGAWEVTVVAPERFHGDLRSIELKPAPGEAIDLQGIRAYLTRSAHLFAYGPGVADVLGRGWDVVHVWEEPYVLAGAQLALLTPRATPLVFLSAQNLDKRYLPPFSTFERFVVGRASAWLACGHTVAATLSARPGYARLPHAVVPLGVDTELFKPDAARGAEVRRSLGWPADGPPVVGYLGRFVTEKGLPLLMRSLDALTRDGVAWRALFVGGGPLEGQLRAWSARQEGRVRVVTGVAHDEVPAHIAAMDVLAAPSQTTPKWREQFGRMISEAYACGVPVVGSDSGEIPFTLGDAGVVVGERDEPGWARALGELLSSHERRRELGERGRSLAERVYAWPAVARRTLELFEAVRDRRSASTDL